MIQVKHEKHLSHTEFLLGEVTKVTATTVVVSIENATSVILQYDFVVVASGISYPLLKEKNQTVNFRADWLQQQANALASAKNVDIVGGGGLVQSFRL